MCKKFLAVLCFVFITTALSACATTSLSSSIDPIVLPEKAEPKFDTASYDSLPGNTKMVVRLSYREVEQQLKTRFPTLSTSRIHSSLSFVQEEAILSSGKPYRRMWLSFVDGTEPGPHGPNSQNIYVWLWPSGDIADVYVSPVLYPL